MASDSLISSIWKIYVKEVMDQLLPHSLKCDQIVFFFSSRISIFIYIYSIVHNVNYVPISMVADTNYIQHKSDYINVANKAPIKADSRLASSQWGTSLQSNAVSHWLGANLEPAYGRSGKLHQRKTWPGTTEEIFNWRHLGSFTTHDRLHKWVSRDCKFADGIW